MLKAIVPPAKMTISTNNILLAILRCRDDDISLRFISSESDQLLSQLRLLLYLLMFYFCTLYLLFTFIFYILCVMNYSAQKGNFRLTTVAP
jgi:ABC-type multidrug transport system permease subunit